MSRSTTPIYDALYDEYRRLFRTLPGEHSDEDQPRFRGFGEPEPHDARWQRTTVFPALPPGRNDAAPHDL